MHSIDLNPSLLAEVKDKTVIITGAAGGIGAETVRIFNQHGAKVVVADLPRSQQSAETLISSLAHPNNAVFIPVNIIDWPQMKALFRQAKQHFGSVDIVVANAGVIESEPVFDTPELDDDGDPKEPTEAFKVIDINLKGTFNTLRLAMHHMSSNPARFSDGSRGSVVLVSSTSAYFGGTGVSAYIASKHGVTGLLRSIQGYAASKQIRVNGVAPCFTPTQITAGFQGKWDPSSLAANTPQHVAGMVVQMTADPSKRGACCLVAGPMLREMEFSRTELMPQWLGEDVTEFLAGFGTLLKDIGGYPLPKLPFE